MTQAKPEKSANAFRTISEVARELELPQHVLRFWETKFTQVKPMKRAGSRRYYRPDDIALLRKIRNLLHDEGYTIKGVQKLLRQGHVQGQANPPQEQTGTAPDVTVQPAANTTHHDDIRSAIAELEGAREVLRAVQK